MNVYQNAVDALKECVKDSMENNVDANLQGEIWRHYQGMKTIAETLTKTELKVAGPPVSYYSSKSPSEMDSQHDVDYNIQAAQPVNLDTYGGDVITFS